MELNVENARLRERFNYKLVKIYKEKAMKL